MNKIFYHASNIGHLSELLPLSTMRGSEEKVCYFTSVRAYALFYLRDMEINHVTCGISDDAIVKYHEQFKGQLEAMYNGRSGYIYSCENNDNIILAHTNGVWAATQPTVVSATEYIENVYDEILKAAQFGEVEIIRFDSLSNEKKNEITDMMRNYIIKNKLLSVDSPKARFIKINFPQAWENAVRK